MLKNITVICDGGAYSLKISSLLYLFFDKNGFLAFLFAILKTKNGPPNIQSPSRH